MGHSAINNSFCVPQKKKLFGQHEGEQMMTEFSFKSELSLFTACQVDARRTAVPAVSYSHSVLGFVSVCLSRSLSPAVE